jgi:hypothetical protein
MEARLGLAHEGLLSVELFQYFVQKITIIIINLSGKIKRIEGYLTVSLVAELVADEMDPLRLEFERR